MKNKKHILIVEDSPDIQLLLSHLFKSEGYTCIQAFNGQEALDILRSGAGEPSFIILDIMMPVMDGFEFRKNQLQDPRLADIPVLVVTADANPKAHAKHFPGTKIIQKPIIDIDGLFKLAEQLSNR